MNDAIDLCSPGKDHSQSKQEASGNTLQMHSYLCRVKFRPYLILLCGRTMTIRGADDETGYVQETTVSMWGGDVARGAFIMLLLSR